MALERYGLGATFSCYTLFLILYGLRAVSNIRESAFSELPNFIYSFLPFSLLQGSELHHSAKVNCLLSFFVLCSFDRGSIDSELRAYLLCELRFFGQWTSFFTGISNKYIHVWTTLFLYLTAAKIIKWTALLSTSELSFSNENGKCNELQPKTSIHMCELHFFVVWTSIWCSILLVFY